MSLAVSIRQGYIKTQIRLMVTIVIVALLVVGFSVSSVAQAQSPNKIVVNALDDSPTTCNKSGVTCLRNAITLAMQNSTALPITFNLSGTITLGSTLEISNSRPILIDGSAQSITIDGGNNIGVFFVYSGSSLTLNKLTIQNGFTVEGGAVLNAGTLNISNSTLYNNHAIYHGGAIFNAGTLVISNSTISNNSSGVSGGGVVNGANSKATISNSTLDNNSANGLGSGLVNYGGELNLLSTIVVGGHAAENSEVYGIVNSLGHNLIGDISDSTGITIGIKSDQVGSSVALFRPNLGVLSLNGGSTKTIAVLSGSPAIGNGDCSGNLTVKPVAPAVDTDQRGMPRSKPCNIGAYEGSTTPPQILLLKTPMPGQSSPGAVSVPGDNQIGN